jgi:tetratricopeptide (TPR) repeat protein
VGRVAESALTIMNINALSHRLVCAWLAGLAAAVLVSSPGPGRAQPAGDQSEVRAIYRKGKTAYDLGHFEEAIEYFKQAYALQPHESYLYNIAQAYRQAGDCRNALFFYKRYVSVGGEKARHYAVVQRRIEELSASCQAAEEAAQDAPASGPDEGQGGSEAEGEGSESATGAGEAGGVVAGESVARVPSDPVLAASLELGGAVLDMGALEVSGAQFSLGVGAGYTLTFGKLGVTLGGLFTYTPVSWSNDRVGVSGTSSLMSVLGNVGVRYAVLDRFALRLELGGGALLLSGLSQGSVFLPDDMMATSTLGMVNVRAGVGAEYKLTDNLVLSASPLVFSYSPPRDGLRAEIDKLVRFDFIAGLGYRM